MRIRSVILLITLASLMAGPAYAKNDKNKKEKPLPPGLQKKVDSGKQLPPGWQKKLVKGEKLDPEVYKQGKIIIPINKHGEITIRVDDKVVRLVKATREIVEVLQ
jgi:hypothetical protein